jgi:uncharacterized membrane protein (DUF106 family)
MTIINVILNNIFNVLMFPFISLPSLVVLIIFSLLYGIIMLFIFRYISNQRGIKNIKNRIKAHFLEIILFKDEPRIILKALRNILCCNFTYLGYLLKPMLVIIPLLIISIIQLDMWFGYRPLMIEESVIVAVKLNDKVSVMNTDVFICTPEGLEVETSALRIEEYNEINWRIKAKESGRFIIEIHTDNQRFEKEVIVGNRQMVKICPKRVTRGFWSELLNPGEYPLLEDSEIKSIEVKYPHAYLQIWRWDNIHWIIVFFVLSIAFGFAMKGILGVEV